MAVVTGPLPYDLANILGGAARVIVSDDSVALPAIPANLKDVVTLAAPYGPKAGWIDIGATGDSTDYTRDMSSSGWDIEQSSASIFEEITEVGRTLKFELAEITPEKLKLLEEAGTIGTVAATAGAVAQKSLKFGTFSSLAKRRMCFIAQRNIGSGAVVEPTTALNRGRFVGLCLYNVSLSADASQLQVKKGQVASVPITMRTFPEPGQAAGQEVGIWLLEDAGTMT